MKKYYWKYQKANYEVNYGTVPPIQENNNGMQKNSSGYGMVPANPATGIKNLKIVNSIRMFPFIVNVPAISNKREIKPHK
ncbi:hypothetical protein DRP05_14480 [Archaeoglobales archaeon]|nr:MAG: hypothetical protein DRP05_14480 [Archaeoglobales archaeon]